ncbi:MAG: ABC transporter substrate-binding protein [Propionibacteriaceae bacterium]|nr:ABC transporter substrate-binding protein [Propionibacteriaceae bacterium]
MSRFKKSKLIGACLLSSLLALSLVGCSPDVPSSPAPTGSQGTTTHEFVDDLGNQVVVANPERVVACMGSFANLWELAGGSLVGISDDALDQYEIASTGASLIGDFTAPNLELIMALEPDFVLMTASTGGKGGGSGHVDLREPLVAAGITVAYFNVITFADYLRTLETLTKITGRDDLFQANGTAVQDQINATIAAQKTLPAPPTVLLMTTFSGGTRVQDPTTMTGAILAELGAKNLAEDYPSLLRDFSLETVIELNPDHILVVPMGNDVAAMTKNLEEATAANPAWATLNAVKNGNYRTLDPALFLYKPNANWGKSYQTLSDILFA